MKKKFVTKMKKIAAVSLAAVTVMGLAAGCGSGKETAGNDKQSSINTESQTKDDTALNQTVHLNIATQPVPGYLPLKLLQDNGWLDEALADYNIEITFTEFESGPPENESFAAGQQDIGVMGNVPTVSGIAAGQERTVIGISYNGEKTIAVIVRPDSDIKSVGDLKGKKIGVVVGSISQNHLDTLLQDSGLSIADVELINLSTGEQQEALATGQVDAVATWEPTITKIETAGTGVVLADGTGLFLGENTIFARSEYVEENPEIVQIFLEQYARAAKELTDNIDQYAEQYAESFGLTPELLKEALSDANFPIAITEDDAKDLQGTADFLYDSGIVSNQVTVQDHIDYSFSEKLQ